jgi:protochlorophyllide reductase
MNNPLHRIILACRTQESADRCRKEVLPLLPNPNEKHYNENIIALGCDHTSFANVHKFNEQLRIKLDETYTPSKWVYNGIDVLCLNAAVLVPKDSKPQYTIDEYEVTLQTNYLTPFLLVHLLMDRMNPYSRIILTTSGLFDRVHIQNFNGIYRDNSDDYPMSPTATTSSNNSTKQIRKRFAMIDDTEFHYKTSYAISKLCVVALCLELVQRIPKDRHITINCFSPGLMTTSGLFRHQKVFSNDCNSITSKESRQEQQHSNTDILQKEKTVEWGAGALVYMSIGYETALRNAEYWSDTYSTLGLNSQYGQQFCPMDISNHVPIHTREELWRLSCELVGVPYNEIDDSTFE